MIRLGTLYAKLFDRLRGQSIRGGNIHKSSVINSGCNIVDTTMERYSYCGNDCQIVSCDVGAFCSISDHVFIGGAEHPLYWLSTSPVFQNTRHSGPKMRFARYDLPKTKRTVIGSDVWIGHGATVKRGITVGNGAVVGSNALVTKDVPPYAVVGGVPAKVIKYRFSQDVIDRLEEIKWWNLPDEEITKRIDLFHIQNPTLEEINRFFPAETGGISV